MASQTVKNILAAAGVLDISGKAVNHKTAKIDGLAIDTLKGLIFSSVLLLLLRLAVAVAAFCCYHHRFGSNFVLMMSLTFSCL